MSPAPEWEAPRNNPPIDNWGQEDVIKLSVFISNTVNKGLQNNNLLS